MRLSDQSALIGPPIDGIKGSDEKMFDLTYVKQDPSKFHLEVQSWREYYDWFL